MRQTCKETCKYSNEISIGNDTLVFAKRAPHFAVNSSCSDIEIWQVGPLRWNKVIEIAGEVRCLSILDDGQCLTVRCERSAADVRIWDPGAFTKTSILTDGRNTRAVDLSANGSRVAFATQNSIECWKLPDNQLLKVFSLKTGAADRLTMLNQKLMYYYANSNKELHVWDIETGELLLHRQEDELDGNPFIDESFFNFGSIANPIHLNHAILKPFYLTQYGGTVMRHEERALVAPPGYWKDYWNCAIFTGSTIVIGSRLGRVVFLPFKH